MVGFDAIRIISKMLHMQHKSLGLKLSGDETISQTFNRNQLDNDKIISNLRRQQCEIGDEINDPTKQNIKVFKKLRRIDQHNKVLNEQLD